MKEVTAPRWATALLRRLAAQDRVEDVVGDLEESHRRRVERRGAAVASVLTSIEGADIAFALLRVRVRRRRAATRASELQTTVPGGKRPSLNVSWIDVKLGFRMLVKYPGLTATGGVAIAFSIWVGASFFEFVTQVIHPRIPLDEGDRIVGIQLRDAATTRTEARALHDLKIWREELTTVRELGAARTVQRNLTVEGLGGEALNVAEVTASAFELARVRPLLGRALSESDELPGAPAVVVVGHDLWQTRLGGDPAVIGRTVRLGNDPHTIVGVMPEGFAFPVSDQLWVPLLAISENIAPREGPGVRVFGRLDEGATLNEAQGELTALGARFAADSPETHEHLRPRLMSYSQSILGMPDLYRLGLASSNVFVIMLLVLVCGNVALLMFARAATREGELIVRTALGASRRRIVTQLFIEALVLGALGAVVGLAATRYGLRLVMNVVQSEVDVLGQLPFWFSDRLSPTTLLYASVLTLLGAVIAGVVPALKVTGRGVERRLRQAAAGGGQVRFGGLWTLIIVSQVAVTVAFPATAYFVRKGLQWERSFDFGFPAARYLSVRLDLDQETRDGRLDDSRAVFIERFASTVRELEARVKLEPQVTGTTFAALLPGMYHPWHQVEVDEGGVAPPDERGYRVGRAEVEPNYFEVLGSRSVLGRGFQSSDVGSDERVVIVNESFVESVLGGANAVGRRIRYVASDDGQVSEPGPWHEIVGVVPDLGVQNGYGSKGIYHAAVPGEQYPSYMLIRLTGDAETFVPRLRELAAVVDPTLRLHSIMKVDEARADEIAFFAFWYRITLMVSTVALFLALAGIYAVMAFTVSRRTREIGIRVALGSDRRRVALSIFRRPLTQVGLGIVLGMMWTSVMAAGWDLSNGFFAPKGAALVAAYALLMLGVCSLACIVPARRALAVEPTVALRAES